jgi:phospholipid/cholesterol/gamma-HCH transport system substrate-binding protein
VSPRLHKGRRKFKPVTAGILTVIVVVFITVVGFTKNSPFSRGFYLNAVVADSAGIKPGSLVRIAGVNVGKVRDVKGYEGTPTSLIRMELQPAGLPVHTDATARIRPRLFLEGNFVIDLTPGTASAPTYKDGGTIPITHTSRSVQLDQVLSTLQGPERKSLQVLLQQFGKVLVSTGTSDEDAMLHGLTTSQSLNATIKAAAASGGDVGDLARALQGQHRGDLTKTIVALARSSAPFADNADALGPLVTGLDQTVSAFANQAAAVRAGTIELPSTIAATNRAVASLRTTLPAVTKVSNNVTPALSRIPGLVKVSGPFLDQAQPFLSSSELGAVLKNLGPITTDLAGASPSLTNTINDLNELSVCSNNVLVPTANQVIQDGSHTTGRTAFQDALSGFVGLAGSAQNFDANGPYARGLSSTGIFFNGGIGKETPGSDNVNIGQTQLQPEATRPAKVANQAPVKAGVACSTQKAPNLSAVASGPADGSGN